MIKSVLVCLILFSFVLCKDPPIYNYSYHVTFDQTFIVNDTNYNINGQQFYDPINNRERIDRANGKYDYFCGSVLPNVTTPCQQYTISNKRWVIFPQKNQCCFCCDSQHGCGILKPDWLSGAEYKGQQQIVDSFYDKWSQDGMVGYNYLWVTADADAIPRRLNEGGKHITDYHTQTFKKQTFAESIFALPAYCNLTTPVNCPLQSACGKHRLSVKLQ